MKSAIGVSEPIRDSNQTVRFNLDIPFRLRRYFEDTELYVGYDFDISEVPDQVLAIPAVILSLPIAWANSVDVEAGYVEKRFVNCVPDLKNAYERLYPGVFDNESELRCKSVESAPKTGSQTGMLFTGGVDSTTTFYRNQDRSPRVINILQSRDSDVKREHQSDDISRFSDLMGVESSTIDTNAHSMLNHETLSITTSGV